MSIILSVDAVGEHLDKNIYGQFIELALNCIHGGIYDSESEFADTDGIRRDVVEKVKELAPPVLRFPGGTIMCQYHWEDAVGPMESRIRRKNLIWGGETDPSFGTAEFVVFCREIGAEPMICVNMASGTPEEAGNWVEYCNGTGNTYYANLRRKHGYNEPFNVKYWCIGNESYAEPDIGVHHNVDLYIRDAWEFIKFMKLTDKTIKTVIVGCENEEWNRPVLESLHSVTDYFSIHHYSGEGNGNIYTPFEGEKHLLETIKKVKALIDTYPERVENFNPWYRFTPRSEKIKIALDEWNIWDFKQDETYGLQQIYCWRDALWVASVLNDIIMEPAIGMANMAQMVNVLAPIVANEEGSYFQTIAYPMKLYRKNMNGKRLQLSFENVTIRNYDDLQALNISAVLREDESICVAVVNRDLNTMQEIDVSQLWTDRRKGIKMITLTCDSPRAVCSMEVYPVITKEIFVAEEIIRILPGSVNLLVI